MPRAVPIFAFLLAALAGCSSVESLREAPDTSPQHPTALMETKVVNNGIKGLVPFEGTTKTWTRADMQRENTTLKGTGTLTRFIVGTTETARIERLDRKVVWTLFPKDKTYTECPLKGCTGPVAEKPVERKPEEPKKDDKPREPDCKLKIAASSFTVKPSGQKKAINGFDTEEYQVAWLITLADPTARKTLSTLSVNVWTTPLTPPLKEAIAVEQAYAKNFAANLANVVAGSPKTQVVPQDAQKLIEGYMARLMTPADRAAFLRAGKELDKIKGYPVLTELTWNLEGDACAAKEEAGSTDSPSGSSSAPTSVSGAVSSVASWFAKKKTDEKVQEIADAAILSFSTEVKSHQVLPVNDSAFQPPANFKLANPK